VSFGTEVIEHALAGAGERKRLPGVSFGEQQQTHHAIAVREVYREGTVPDASFVN
jgi:hypothetical protein